MIYESFIIFLKKKNETLIMMRVVALSLLLMGIVFITIGYTKMSFKCPNPRVEYRYIPRQVYEEQLYDQNLMGKFRDMFADDSPNKT